MIIDKQSWSPVFYFKKKGIKDDDIKVDITDDKVKEIEEVFFKFNEVQKYLIEVYREARCKKEEK